MRKLFVVLITGLVAAACSPTKHSAYIGCPTNSSVQQAARKFGIKHNKSPYRKGSLQVTKSRNALKKEDFGSEKSSKMQPKAIALTSKIQILDRTLFVSASKTFTHPGKIIGPLVSDPRPNLPAITGKSGKGFLATLKEIKANRKSNSPINKEGDKNKNKFAIAGFSTVAAGVIYIAAMMGATAPVKAIVIGGLILIGIGMILSRIGRKSQRRTLSRIGFWVGVGVLGFGAFMGLVSLWLESLDAI